jgi:hypothetical protein
LPEGFKLEDTTSSTTESSTSLLADILLSIEKKEKTGSTGERGSSGSSTGSRLGGFRPHGGTANRPFKSKQTDHNEHSGTTESSKSQSVNPLSGVRSIKNLSFKFIENLNLFFFKDKTIIIFFSFLRNQLLRHYLSIPAFLSMFALFFSH